MRWERILRHTCFGHKNENLRLRAWDNRPEACRSLPRSTCWQRLAQRAVFLAKMELKMEFQMTDSNIGEFHQRYNRYYIILPRTNNSLIIGHQNDFGPLWLPKVSYRRNMLNSFSSFSEKSSRWSARIGPISDARTFSLFKSAEEEISNMHSPACLSNFQQAHFQQAHSKKKSVECFFCPNEIFWMNKKK